MRLLGPSCNVHPHITQPVPLQVAYPGKLLYCLFPCSQDGELTRSNSSLLMASTASNNGDEPRRRPLQAYNSFPRIDSDVNDSTRRSRASTLDRTSRNLSNENGTSNAENVQANSEQFPSTNDRLRTGTDNSGGTDAIELPSGFDELPVELISLTDTQVSIWHLRD